MANLFFKHSDGRMSLVRKGIGPAEVHQLIEDYTTRISNGKFEIHYARCHTDEIHNSNGTDSFVTHYDVGSWSEFFYYTDLDMKELKKHLRMSA